jgi:hypothetical protein
MRTKRVVESEPSLRMTTQKQDIFLEAHTEGGQRAARDWNEEYFRWMTDLYVGF